MEWLHSQQLVVGLLLSKKRNNISFRGRSEVNRDVVESIRSRFCEGRESKNVYSTDEPGSFQFDVTRNTYQLKGKTYFVSSAQVTFQNQNQNCLLVIPPKTIIYQDLRLAELVPSPYRRSKLSTSGGLPLNTLHSPQC